LNKSKSTATTAAAEEDEDSDSRYGTGRSRYMALKERRTRLARSRSSHNFGGDDDEPDEPLSPTTTSPSAYLASRYTFCVFQFDVCQRHFNLSLSLVTQLHSSSFYR